MSSLQRDNLDARAIRVDVRVELSNGRFEGAMHAEGGSGIIDRNVQGERCDEVLSALREMLVIVADSIAPMDAPTLPVPVPAPEQTSAVPVPVAIEGDNATPAADMAPPEQAERVGGYVATSGLVDFTSLGGLTGGLRVHGGATWRGWSFGALMTLLPNRDKIDDNGRGGKLGLVTFGVRAAYAFAFGRWAVAPYLFTDAGVTYGRGVGIAAPEVGYGIWASSGFGLVGRLQVEPSWALFLEAEGVVPWFRPQWGFGTEIVAKTGAFGGRLGIGLELFF